MSTVDVVLLILSHIFNSLIILLITILGMLDTLVAKMEYLLPRKKVDIFGKGQLMHTSVPYYLLSLLMLGTYKGNVNAGFGLIFLVYTILPLLDEFFNLDIKNPTE